MSETPHAPTLLDGALDYAARGFPVLPLQAQGKKPLTEHGVKDATTGPSQLRSWWRRWPQANVGLAVEPGFLVLDLDSPEALQRLRAQDLFLPTTATATTRKGYHFWFSTGKTAIRNRVRIFPDADIRASGGYVVAPPSIHPSGAIYRWQVELERSAITECPEWLLERLAAHTPRRGRSAEEWHRKIASKVPRGQRNNALAEVAGFYFRFLPARVAEEAAYCWAQVKLDPPLPDQEIRRTLESIAGLEVKRRRGEA